MVGRGQNVLGTEGMPGEGEEKCKSKLGQKVLPDFKNILLSSTIGKTETGKMKWGFHKSLLATFLMNKVSAPVLNHVN